MFNGGSWHHPQLTPAQQTARRAVDVAEQGLVSGLTVYYNTVRLAAINGTAVPAPYDPTTVFAPLVAAEAASKAADVSATTLPASANN